MEADEVLDRAADLLMIYGRCTQTGEDAQGRICLVGAMARAEGKKASGWNHYLNFAPTPTGLPVAVRALGEFLARTPELLPSWVVKENRTYVEPYFFNDDTEDDDLVIDTLRRCAKELRG